MFLPRKYRVPKAFLALLGIELPFTVAILALFGIASPDLYRTRLWQDGANNGFNSDPNLRVYAYANFRSYDTPLAWTSFITNFNLVISVLSMFFLLVKAPMYILHVFYPPFSVLVHATLTALYAVSIRYQAASDMADPKHPQPGPPWYIAKSCSVTFNPDNIGYCKQAKSAFACTIIMLVIFVFHFVLAVVSCFPTKEEREERAEQKRQELEFEENVLKSPSLAPQTPGFPQSPGALPPVTPRTQAFNTLGGTSGAPRTSGTSDLPLRDRGNPGPQPLSIPNSAAATPAARTSETPQMYFPPPPKASK